MLRAKRKAVVVVMDGIGVRESNFGNAVNLARTPSMKYLKQNGLYRTLKAHGTFVGLPTDLDIGNSEVGHNSLGAGRIFDQGAKLVQSALDSGSLFQGSTWLEMINGLSQSSGTLHFIGLLSDGNVHSHESHLYKMLRQAKRDGLHNVRIHILLDGRDVGEKTAEIYIERLYEMIGILQSSDFEIKVASGGGRMTTTMDRYGADWSMVEKGWAAHVLGEAPLSFSSLQEAMHYFRLESCLADQYIPPFVIKNGNLPVGPIIDGDAVVFFNFRGDRAIEISRAFCEPDFSFFDRKRFPKVFFAGMMEYDGDLHIPPKYLVAPPQISNTLGEYLSQLGLRQFACSETQKFGHVTYFWNGNRSGKFDDRLEEYLEIPSDNIHFDLKPWMKAYEITEATIQKMFTNEFDFARINYANGDMVGHTGNLNASILAVSTVDLCLGRLIQAARATNTVLLVTADHGNCDEMFDSSQEGPENWEDLPHTMWPKAKTAHTLNEVPFYFYDPLGVSQCRLTNVPDAGISRVASTVIDVLGLPRKSEYMPSLLERL